MIDVSSIINDPDFNLPFIRIPVTGSWQGDGSWQFVEGAQQAMNGIILPSKLDELAVLPEGERLKGSISIYCLTALVQGDNALVQADIIGYLGDWYRVQYLRYYEQCVLWYAIATKFQRKTVDGQE
jgi:hypothetical protein